MASCCKVESLNAVIMKNRNKAGKKKEINQWMNKVAVLQSCLLLQNTTLQAGGLVLVYALTVPIYPGNLHKLDLKHF